MTKTVNEMGALRRLELAHHQVIAALVAVDQGELVRWEAIRDLRIAGWTWAAIGRRIGLSAQDVIALFLSDPDTDPTL